MTERRLSQAGVTLPELLVALFVFALISSIGVYVMRLAVDGRAQLVVADETLREWQLARLIIREDLMQIVNRSVRDEFGAAAPGPVIGGLGFSGRTPVSDETPLVAFVKNGWANYSASTPRSSLQYIEYVAREDRLIRRTRTYLDDARDQPRQDRILFENVTDVELEFLAGETTRGLEWSADWPGPSGGGVPQAIRLRMSSDQYGEIEQLFWIGEIHTDRL